MAALKNHGVEIARLAITANIADSDYEITYSFRSDGHIMRSLKVLNVHSTGPRDHNYGWKLWKKLQDPKRDTRQRQAALAQKWADNAQAAGKLLSFTKNIGL